MSFSAVYRRVVIHWRAVILVLIIAFATFLIAQADFFDLLVFALFLICITSQFFSIGRILDLGERLIPGKPRRAWLAIVAGFVYLFIFPTSPRADYSITSCYDRRYAAGHMSKL